MTSHFPIRFGELGRGFCEWTALLATLFAILFVLVGRNPLPVLEQQAGALVAAYNPSTPTGHATIASLGSEFSGVSAKPPALPHPEQAMQNAIANMLTGGQPMP